MSACSPKSCEEARKGVSKVGECVIWPPALCLSFILLGQRLDSHGYSRIPDCLPGGWQWEPLRLLPSQGPVGTCYMLKIDGDNGGDPGPETTWAGEIPMWFP